MVNKTQSWKRRQCLWCEEAVVAEEIGISSYSYGLSSGRFMYSGMTLKLKVQD